MTENKKTSKISFWKRFSQILKSSKRVLIYFFLFILFLLSIVVLWEKYSKDKTLKFPQVQVKIENSKPHTEIAKTVEGEKKTIEVTQKNTHESPQQLITIQLLEGVLEGWIPLSTFKTYLQKHPSGETPYLLLELSTISNCPTYAELQSSLPSASVKSKSLWERLKSRLKSLIQIKKIDKEKVSETSSPKKIEKAIYEKNVSEVLNLFDKLPEDEKIHFSPWMKKVQERLKVEILYKHLLIKLAQGQT
ncbi:MAG: hypothetical protein K2Y08_01620 [Alphaproteobacteria bacterium]|nr:hypothetical protein [Alphaproteobacteria bacterium]